MEGNDTARTANTKNWCFTLNNYTAEQEMFIQTCNRGIKYLIYGREVAATGTPHLQGFVQFTNVKNLQQAKAYFNIETIHLEMMRGTALQASDYCKKSDSNPWVFGTP